MGTVEDIVQLFKTSCELSTLPLYRSSHAFLNKTGAWILGKKWTQYCKTDTYR